MCRRIFEPILLDPAGMDLCAESGADISATVVVPEANDILRLSFIGKQDATVAVGYLQGQRRVKLSSPSLYSNSYGEIFVEGASENGARKKYRVVSSAFGEYDNIVAAARNI